jgi:glutamine synthetase
MPATILSMAASNGLDVDTETLQLDNLDFVQFRYTDLMGKFLAKYVAIYNRDPFQDLNNGIALDGSSVKGFSDISESDLLLVPDKSTLRLMPHYNYRVATVVADVYQGFGKGRLIRDPRYVSQLLERALKAEGLVCQIGPEVECFVFDDIGYGKEGVPEILSSERFGKYRIRTKHGYDAPPFQDSSLDLRFEVAEILKKNYLLKVTQLNHEVASSGQMEINFTHSTITKAADNVQIYKDIVRTIAKKHDKVANFMPKPVFDENDPRSNDNDNGSGMHVSTSIWTGGKNVFYDPDDNYAELSQTGRYFIGGILMHASSLAAVVSPTVNSYYRLIPGFEAPVYAAWSRGNRSAILRVPVNEKNNGNSKRIEFRAPDPSANPYLAFSAIVAAGLHGIREKIDPGDPVNDNIYKMDGSSRTALGIGTLPRTLQDSIDALKNDVSYLKPYFDKELIDTYIQLKCEEVEFATGSKERQFTLYYDI